MGKKKKERKTKITKLKKTTECKATLSKNIMLIMFSPRCMREDCQCSRINIAYLSEVTQSPWIENILKQENGFIMEFNTNDTPFYLNFNIIRSKGNVSDTYCRLFQVNYPPSSLYLFQFYTVPQHCFSLSIKPL